MNWKSDAERKEIQFPTTKDFERGTRNENKAMSVLVETSKGELVIDLFATESPIASMNFLKLCKLKQYNDCKFFSVQKDFAVQTGDPSNTGEGGKSIYSFLSRDETEEKDENEHFGRFFKDEITVDKEQNIRLKHDHIGTVSCANFGREDTNQSQFLITTRDSVPDLDGKHTIFGRVMEGLDVLQRINEAYCDENGRPWQNIRIKRTTVLDDPFEDPEGMPKAPDESPLVDRSVQRRECSRSAVGQSWPEQWPCSWWNRSEGSLLEGYLHAKPPP